MPRTSYIIKREKKLVEKSSIADLPEYSGLVDVLSRYDIVNDKVLEMDAAIDEPTKYTIKNTWAAIVVNAADEWQFYNFADKKSKCMLDNKDIKTEYYIKNKVNGNQLTVGSECVKHFGFENGLDSGVTSKSYIAQQQREQRRIRRREDITKLYGNIDRQLNDYYSQLTDCPVLLNTELFHTAKKKIDVIKQFYDDFVDSKERDATLFPALKQDIDVYLNDVVKLWVDNQKDKLFSCTLDDARFLVAENHLDIVTRIRDNDGLLDEETVVYVSHAKFINKHLKTFRHALSPYFRVIHLTPSGLHIAFESDNLAGIDYNISPKNFLEMFSGVLFDKPVVKRFSDYYSICTFADTTSNRWNLIEALYHFFQKSSYDFLYDEDKFSFLLVGPGKYCDSLTLISLVKHIIPLIAVKQRLEQIENMFFNRLKWTKMDNLNKEARKDINETIRNLRKTRNQLVEAI